MPYRKIALAQGEIYHIFNKSIAGFKIFNSNEDFKRFLETMVYYSNQDRRCKFSLFLKNKQRLPSFMPKPDTQNKLVKIIAYCIMPTHVHFIIQQLETGGISKFINLILKSYSKYFNIKHNRKGPLWESRFKSVLIKTDAQFLHLTRYIHLNPVSAFIVNDPKDWEFSSYREYVGLVEQDDKKCDFSSYFYMDNAAYKEFVNSRINYQRDLEVIKHLILD